MGVWSNFTVAGASDSALIEAWQGDVCAAIRPTGTSLEVWTVNGGILHTEASAFTASTFARVEMGWRVSTLDAGNGLNHDGWIELKINDVVKFTADNIQLGFAIAPGATRDVFWNVTVFNPHGDGAKLYLNNGAGTVNNSYMPANVNIYTQHAVAGNGYYTELTPSSGTDQGAMLDETTSDDSTTYVSGEGAALKSTVNHADFADVGSQYVYALKQVGFGRKMSPGYRRFRPLAYRSGGWLPQFGATEYPLGMGYFAWMQHVWELDPFLGTRLRVDLINITEFGVLVA